MSPEVVFKKPYNENIDVWSMGVLLYELLHGRSAFKAKNLNEISMKLRRPIELQFDGGLSEEVKDLITGILKNDPRLLEVYTDELLQIFYEVFNELFQQLDSAKAVDLENISQKLLESKDPAKIKKLLNQATRHLNVEFKASSKEKVIAELKVMAALLNDAGFHKIKDSFDSLTLVRKGEFSFKLWTRDFNDLVSAEMTGDCTSPGDSGFNFWTVPAWLANRGFNMLYLYGPDQKLIYKAGLLVTIDENKKPLLIIDSIEVGKETLKNYSKEKERQYLNLLITRTQKIAQNMHINPDHVYAVTASNTGQPITGLGSIVKVNHQPLAGSQNLFFQDKARALFYFQSLWDVARYEESAYECEKMIRNYIDEKKPEYEKLMQFVENQAFAETVDFLRKNIVNTNIAVLETGINFLFHSTMKDFTVATAHLLSFAAQDKKSILDMDLSSVSQEEVEHLLAESRHSPKEIQLAEWQRIWDYLNVENLSRNALQHVYLLQGMKAFLALAFQNNLFDETMRNKILHAMDDLTEWSQQADTLFKVLIPNTIKNLHKLIAPYFVISETPEQKLIRLLKIKSPQVRNVLKNDKELIYFETLKRFLLEIANEEHFYEMIKIVDFLLSDLGVRYQTMTLKIVSEKAQFIFGDRMTRLATADPLMRINHMIKKYPLGSHFDKNIEFIKILYQNFLDAKLTEKDFLDREDQFVNEEDDYLNEIYMPMVETLILLKHSQTLEVIKKLLMPGMHKILYDHTIIFSLAFVEENWAEELLLAQLAFIFQKDQIDKLESRSLNLLADSYSPKVMDFLKAHQELTERSVHSHLQHVIQSIKKNIEKKAAEDRTKHLLRGFNRGR